MRTVQFLVLFGLGAGFGHAATVIEFRSGLEAWGLTILAALVVVGLSELGRGGET